MVGGGRDDGGEGGEGKGSICTINPQKSSKSMLPPRAVNCPETPSPTSSRTCEQGASRTRDQRGRERDGAKNWGTVSGRPVGAAAVAVALLWRRRRRREWWRREAGARLGGGTHVRRRRVDPQTPHDGLKLVRADEAIVVLVEQIEGFPQSLVVHGARLQGVVARSNRCGQHAREDGESEEESGGGERTHCTNIWAPLEAILEKEGVLPLGAHALMLHSASSLLCPWQRYMPAASPCVLCRVLPSLPFAASPRIARPMVGGACVATALGLTPPLRLASIAGNS